MKFGEIFYLL